jgi:outer membrane receptor protein involved in Fe transport
MSRRAIVLLAVFSSLASAGFAQTTGNIRGVVSDETGAVLPGASVTIASDALIGGPQTATTNNLGVYRFPSVAVGTYVVEVSLDGFETLRVEGVRVGINATATVDAALKLKTVAETVTVSGEAPVLDTTKAGFSSNWKTELIEELPSNRNMWEWMQVSPGVSASRPDGQSSRVVAFGSGNQSNAWNVDGIEVTSPDTGSSWWWVNPDLIEEVEVMGVGVPAEYGNALGAVLNVVTKGGGNEFRGGANYFLQTDSLTASNVTQDGFGFGRKTYRDVTANLGGPIAKDRVWFMGAMQHNRDASTPPGIDPALAPTNESDRFDFKMSAQLTDKHRLDGLVHHEIWYFPYTLDPVIAPSATGAEGGTNPAWKLGLTSVFSDSTLFEAKYAGWWGDDLYESITGSTEEPIIDYSPPGGGATTYSGGLYYPWEYVQWRHQFDSKVTKYAESFLGAQHDFKFGVQYSYGLADTNIRLSEVGSYIYHYAGAYYDYLYRVEQQPYTYGGTSTNLGFFLDDSVTVGDRLTLNLGVRYDRSRGTIPPSERLSVPGFEPTGESVPGAEGLINWNTVSPRGGFALQMDREGRSVLRGSLGLFYDKNVMGNWDGQVSERPPFDYYAFNPDTGEFDTFAFQYEFAKDVFNYDLDPPKMVQYSLGYERELGNDLSAGVEYVYKDVEGFIGWDILGGSYEPVPFTDPFTGNQLTLLNQLEEPTVQKGNGPELPEDVLQILGEQPRYESTYHGLFFTFNKRFSNGWGLTSSYTWSRSEGLLPNALSQSQQEPLYAVRTGSNPNNLINARGRLQGDRPHMFRLQGVFQLPWELLFSASLNFSSGAPFNRQIRLFNLGVPGGTTVIMEPSGSTDALRRSSFKNVDFRVGRRVALSERVSLRLDATLLNAFNDDAELFFSTLQLDEGEEFSPSEWVLPRRLMLRVGVEF